MDKVDKKVALKYYRYVRDAHLPLSICSESMSKEFSDKGWSYRFCLEVLSLCALGKNEDQFIDILEHTVELQVEDKKRGKAKNLTSAQSDLFDLIHPDNGGA